MKEFPNFISVYDNALTKNECKLIIDEFESNKNKHVRGKSGNYEVQPEVKDSTDLGYAMNDKSITSTILSKSLNFPWILSISPNNQYMMSIKCENWVNSVPPSNSLVPFHPPFL